MQVGLGYERSSISLEQGYDINIFTPTGGANIKTIVLSSDQIILTAAKTYITNDCLIYGSLSCFNVGNKTPIYFSTNRNININGTMFS